jgi:hypothetical protein
MVMVGYSMNGFARFVPLADCIASSLPPSRKPEDVSREFVAGMEFRL